MPEYRLVWSPERQMFGHGAAKYVHTEATPIEPSHDLAHLLVAACSELPWLPEGSDADVRLCEYNAVLLENILDRAFDAVFKPEIEASIVDRTASNARWFADVYYAPFPISADEAYRRFCSGLDVAALTRLSPYFFRQKRREMTSPLREFYRFSFRQQDVPPARGELAAFQHIVQSQLQAMRR